MTWSFSFAQAIIWCMFAGSLAAWTWWLANVVMGQTVINRRETVDVPWPPIAAFSGTVIGFAVPVLLLTLVVVSYDVAAIKPNKPATETAAETSESGSADGGDASGPHHQTNASGDSNAAANSAVQPQKMPRRPLTRQDVVVGVGLKFLQLVTVLAVVWICSPAGSIKPPHLGLQTTGLGYDLYSGFFGLLFAMLPVYAVNLALLEYRKTAPDGTGFHQFLGVMRDSPDWDFVALLAFSAVIVAPVVEEVLYRVILQPSLIQGLGHRMGLIATAALFAGAHYQPNNPDPLALFPLALVLGWVYDRRQSLPAVLLLHGLFNGLNLTLLLLYRD